MFVNSFFKKFFTNFLTHIFLRKRLTHNSTKKDSQRLFHLL